jgi:rRNA biogenesis protein RRP5
MQLVPLRRVLSVDHARGRAVVTHKKTLMKSELPIIADASEAVPGATTHGVVTGVEAYGAAV